MPKTVRNVFDKALSIEKLTEAHKKCQKTKRNKDNVIRFNLKQEEYISWLYEQLKTRTYKHGGYTRFVIKEPKVRQIEASSYKDRIVHRWCVDNFLDKYFTPKFIPNSYACIKGKGMHEAALDLQKAMRKCKKQYGSYYILKMDIEKYFLNINKDILMQILSRTIKDKDVLWILSEIVYSKNCSSGIPLGNLTSQMFANIYYNEVDQYIKHKLKVRYYFRYMDDSVILMQNKEEIKQVKKQIEDYIHKYLGLKFNKKTNIFKSKQGVNFCGYKINEYRIKIRDKGKRKLKKKVKYLKKQILLKNMNSKEAKKYLCGHFGYLKYSNSYSLTNKIFAKG